MNDIELKNETVATTVTPISEGRRTRKRPEISTKAMNAALLEQQGAIFEAAGIVRMVSRVLFNDDVDPDTWTALDGAYGLLRKIADRLQSCEAILTANESRDEAD